MILSLRSNSLGQLGVVINDDEIIKFSSYIFLCDSRHLSPPPSPMQSQMSLAQQFQKPQISEVTVSFSFQANLYDSLIHVLDCIRWETEWSVLKLAFIKLSKMLKNKGLIFSLGKYPSASSPTPSMVHTKTEPSFPDLVVNVLERFVSKSIIKFKLIMIFFFQIQVETLQIRLSTLIFSDCDKKPKADILAIVYLSFSELVSYSLTSANQVNELYFFIDLKICYFNFPFSFFYI